MIPISILSKMGIYELEIHGVKVTANLVDDARLIDDYVTELRSSLKKPIVGFDVKLFQHNKYRPDSPELLILSMKNRCLIMQLQQLPPVLLPSNLEKFLDDDSICFVGTEMEKKVRSLYTNYTLSFKGGRFDVGELAARVLKKPNLMSNGCGLAEVATEAGVKFEPPTDDNDVQWKSKVFTDEEIKKAIYEAYTCNVIGDKLLGRLGIRDQFGGF